MRVFLLVCSASGLILTIIPPLLFFTGTADLSWVGTLMTVGMLLWFAGDVPRALGGILRQRK